MAKCLSHSPPSFHFGAAAFALASLRAKFCWLAESKLGTAIPSQKPAFAGATARQSSLSTTFRAKTGAGGETRTHTTFYGPRILSPVRLPFRHTGTRCANASRDSPRRKVRTSWHGSCRVSQAAEIPASRAQSAALFCRSIAIRILPAWWLFPATIIER